MNQTFSLDQKKKIMEIFFSDLKPEVQVAVLEYYKISKPEDMQLDIYPLCTIEEEV